jgi:hypothetical protein
MDGKQICCRSLALLVALAGPGIGSRNTQALLLVMQ